MVGPKIKSDDVGLFVIAQLPVRVAVKIMAHARTFHEIHAQGEESVIALKGASNVCYLQMGGQLLDFELVIVH
jgi:hypothetical protein